MKILAIDIGGTFIKYAVMDEECRMGEKGKIPTPQTGREDLVDSLVALFSSFDREEKLEGMAISMPGIVDAENGYVSMGGALAYNNDFYLRNVLHRRLTDAKITINNDAKCAAQAEASIGALKDVKDGVVLIFGTMIGGGIVLDHRVRQGVHFAAGEVSYIISDREAAPACETVWGNRCGTPSLCRNYAQRKNLNPSEVDGIRVFEAVHAGDEDAVAVLSEFTKNVAVQIFNLQTILDPGRFAIGGGISAQPVFIEYIKRHLEQMYAMSPYFVPHAEVVSCKFGNDANLVGAFQCYQYEKGQYPY